MNRPGFVASGAQGYQSKFGMALKAPTRIAITKTNMLLAESVGVIGDQGDVEKAEGLGVDYFSQSDNRYFLIGGDMLIPDMIIADASPFVAMEMTNAGADVYLANGDGIVDNGRGLGVREVVEANSSALNPDAEQKTVISPVFDAEQYFRLYENRSVQKLTSKLGIKILRKPSHGELLVGGEVASDYATDDISYSYVPGKEFIGRDEVVYQVEIDGHKVVVYYYIHVIDYPMQGTNPYNNECIDAKTNPWRVSSGDAANMYQSAVSGGIIGTIPSYAVSWSDIVPDFVLAQTTGISANATIALDTNAAGHGWFIDYTPYLNEEFLPTADANEWVAKPGSEAEGKMDLLTVLWHEYGHALGLDHSADAHDFMGATLAPGVRRTLTAEEMSALRALLVAGSPNQSSDPDNSPGVPLPVPLLPGFTRLGRSRNSALTLALSRGERGFEQDVSVPQYQAVANTTLTNGDLNSSDGWAVQGSVDIGNGAAVLKETSTSQTRLNQVFLLGENDRFISFTLDNIALDDQAAGPDDAFEVGLLDANTGAS